MDGMRGVWVAIFLVLAATVGLVACGDDDPCADGSCNPEQGLVLTGELAPAGGSMGAGSLQLHGTIAADFPRNESRAGALSLEHVGLTSKPQGDLSP